ncbi:MAG: YggS family pyridoxal phosphate-dependent enzyme [Candidatus Dormibacteria bacterium]
MRERLAEAQERLAAACVLAGRRPSDVTLLAASKYATLEQATEIAAAGQRAFGENRLVEGIARKEALQAAGFGCEWHFIGHLQSNKAPRVVDNFDVIQSIDSRHLADSVSRRVMHSGRTVPTRVFLQVNIANDPAKQGFSVAELEEQFGEVVTLKGIELRGLMTIPTVAASAAASRPHFAALRELRDRLNRRDLAPPMDGLSMGMSSDFEVAIAEGATIVRLGTVLFGERSSPS